MINIEKDIEYKNIIHHILDNEEFNKMKEVAHHDTNRFEHSLKVSYYSYKIAKALKLDYEDVARAGLLHDFFLTDTNIKMTKRLACAIKHPKYAAQKSEEIFGISEKEKDIIKTHMFPLNLNVPKYTESWLVTLVDKGVALKEQGHKYGYKLAYFMNMYLLFLINSIK